VSDLVTRVPNTWGQPVYANRQWVVATSGVSVGESIASTSNLLYNETVSYKNLMDVSVAQNPNPFMLCDYEQYESVYYRHDVEYGLGKLIVKDLDLDKKTDKIQCVWQGVAVNRGVETITATGLLLTRPFDNRAYSVPTDLVDYRNEPVVLEPHIPYLLKAVFEIEILHHKTTFIKVEFETPEHIMSPPFEGLFLVGESVRYEVQTIHGVYVESVEANPTHILSFNQESGVINIVVPDCPQKNGVVLTVKTRAYHTTALMKTHHSGNVLVENE
jgi:hypothetical protein